MHSVNLGRYLRPPYTCQLIILLLVLSVPLCRRHSGDWDNVYVPAAKHIVASEIMFQDGFVYPPVNALLAMPVISLPPIVGVIGWYAVSSVALICLVQAAWRLSRPETAEVRHD